MLGALVGREEWLEGFSCGGREVKGGSGAVQTPLWGGREAAPYVSSSALCATVPVPTLA